jgi:hypothetical protein
VSQHLLNALERIGLWSARVPWRRWAIRRYLELRIERRFNEQMRWMMGLVLPIYALVLGVILTVAIFGFTILGKLPLMVRA